MTTSTGGFQHPDTLFDRMFREEEHPGQPMVIEADFAELELRLIAQHCVPCPLHCVVNGSATELSSECPELFNRYGERERAGP